jgi:hypothetical protein
MGRHFGAYKIVGMNLLWKLTYSCQVLERVKEEWVRDQGPQQTVLLGGKKDKEE